MTLLAKPIADRELQPRFPNYVAILAILNLIYSMNLSSIITVTDGSAPAALPDPSDRSR